MAAAILAAKARGTSRIEGVDCVRTSYPSFADDFNRLSSM
jgi:5-enolpyruvylshikimate-3-phosphate synthase